VSIVTGVTRIVSRPARGIALLAALALVPAAAVASSARATPGPARPAARHEVYPVPPSGDYILHGRGFGHGHGLSQWGAYGAAKVDHLSANQILHFYYPHTSLATRPTTRAIRVLLTATNASSRGILQLAVAPGLTLTPASGPAVPLSAKTGDGRAISAWRLQRDGAAIDLRRRVSGHWHTQAAVGASATITDKAQQIPVVEGTRTVRYRGAIVGEIENTSLEAVNVVNLELYLRGVVPAEMSSSWSAAALQAQAVAARTYATRGVKNPKASWYDVDGDTRDQAYGGTAVEAKRTTNAVQRTAGEVVVDSSGHAIFAQYAAADGGWTVAGGQPYLPAKHDPYDGLVPNTGHAWITSVPVATIEAAFPAVGTLTSVTVTGRDGNGLWGGRVTAVTLAGSKGSVQTTGLGLQFALGLRSPWFRPIPTPAAPSALKANANGKTITVTWKAPHSVRGAAPVTGYRVKVSPGKHKLSLPASARSASVSKLPAGSYTVTVVARSGVGRGPGSSVVVKTGHK
jgi:SpoIID/LytB domain protein